MLNNHAAVMPFVPFRITVWGEKTGKTEKI